MDTELVLWLSDITGALALSILPLYHIQCVNNITTSNLIKDGFPAQELTASHSMESLRKKASSSTTFIKERDLSQRQALVTCTSILPAP